jgi:hypothetical protein
MKNILRLFLVVILTQFLIAQTPNFEGCKEPFRDRS